MRNVPGNSGTLHTRYRLKISAPTWTFPHTIVTFSRFSGTNLSEKISLELVLTFALISIRVAEAYTKVLPNSLFSCIPLLTKTTAIMRIIQQGWFSDTLLSQISKVKRTESWNYSVG